MRYSTGQPAVTALAGSIGESVAFYAVVTVRERRARRRGRVGGGVMRRLLLEFGPAEALDTLAVRPLAMHLRPLLLGNVAAGITLGKIAADLVFYALAVVGYELGRAGDRSAVAAADRQRTGVAG